MFIGSCNFCCSYFYSVDYQDEAEIVLPNKETSGEGITFLKSHELFLSIIDVVEAQQNSLMLLLFYFYLHCFSFFISSAAAAPENNPIETPEVELCKRYLRVV